MSTTVVLLVTPCEPIEPDRHFYEVPDDLAAALAAAGQSSRHGVAQHAGGPWRFHFQLSGPDRLAAGSALVEDVRGLGYDADLRISP
ncbi:MAG: hypothetical protein M3P93_05685 [Actinomycetota bacterium]|nr:hypothetical protein [Actinomycetota bacterium]